MKRQINTIIGIFPGSHDSSIAYIKNNKIIWHIEMERIIRIKRAYRIIKDGLKIKPYQIISDYFKKIDIIPDCYAFCGHYYPDFNFSKGYKLIGERFKNAHLPDNINSNIHIKHRGINYYYVDHHIAHAAYAFYTSKFSKADQLIYDGEGNIYNGKKLSTIFIKSDGEIINLCPNNRPLGKHYSYAANAFFGQNKEAGKVMGAAAYGKPDATCYKHIELLNKLESKEHVKYLIKQKEKKGWDYISNFSATLQEYFERHVLEYLLKYKTCENLCISGGCGLNGYLNQRVLEEGIYKNIYVPPACNDGGLSIGAALHANYNFNKKRITHNIAYLGRSFVITENVVKELTGNIKLTRNKQVIYKAMSLINLFPYVAGKIAEGKIIGWYQGRSESGPRALGNRSILCDPRNPDMKNYLNMKVKNRESFRPFAPAILKEYVSEWFENVTDAKYMLKICKYKPGMGEKVPAVCHEDYTGRVQTVSQEDNHYFYHLIKAFYKITGIPILLNTSFNKHEPIVDIPEDAFKCFMKTGIDILVLGNFVLEKKNKMSYPDKKNI
jgi:carbamoyltransferase